MESKPLTVGQRGQLLLVSPQRDVTVTERRHEILADGSGADITVFDDGSQHMHFLLPSQVPPEWRASAQASSADTASSGNTRVSYGIEFEFTPDPLVARQEPAAQPTMKYHAINLRHLQITEPPTIEFRFFDQGAYLRTSDARD